MYVEISMKLRSLGPYLLLLLPAAALVVFADPNGFFPRTPLAMAFPLLPRRDPAPPGRHRASGPTVLGDDRGRAAVAFTDPLGSSP
jgi:hypothetical protein